MDNYITCIIVDNEPLNLEIMEEFISKIEYLQLLSKCENAFEALDFLQSNHVDLMFSDIQMPKINGLELVNSLPNPPAIIFATAFSDYALNGFDLGIIDYLLKPISFQRFLKASNKAKAVIEQKKLKSKPESTTNENIHLFIKENDKLIKVLYRDINYIEAMGDYIKINTTNGMLVTYSTLKGFEERLSQSKFVRTHKSFIIQINAIKSISGNTVILNNGIAIPISKNYKEAFQAAVLK